MYIIINGLSINSVY